DARALKTVSEKLRPLARSTSPFARGTPAGRDHHWVDPELVGEVRFTEWTRDGGIRHPSFLGLREDKRPEECVRETAVVAAGEGAGEGRGGGDGHERGGGVLGGGGGEEVGGDRVLRWGRAGAVCVGERCAGSAGAG